MTEAEFDRRMNECERRLGRLESQLEITAADLNRAKESVRSVASAPRGTRPA